MIGLMYFLIFWGYFVLARAVYRNLKVQSATGSRWWAGFTIALPTWYFFGFMLSGNYWEYLAGCETDAGPHIVQPVPTEIPYSKYCSTAKRLLPNSGYEAVECEEKGQYLRFTFIGTELVQCSTATRWGDYDEECFERKPIDTLVTPHDIVYRQAITEKSSWISVGKLFVSDTNVVLPDGTLVAYQRHYSYFPQGSAIWLGGSSGAAPKLQCKRGKGFMEIVDMFPPLD